VAAVVGEHDAVAAPTLDDVLAAEQWARTRTREVLA
jgi:1-deoxy-D-xylulose-5-phosphate reductoisomerase